MVCLWRQDGQEVGGVAVALANQLTNQDLLRAPEILARFNSQQAWYYGMYDACYAT